MSSPNYELAAKTARKATKEGVKGAEIKEWKGHLQERTPLAKPGCPKSDFRKRE